MVSGPGYTIWPGVGGSHIKCSTGCRSMPPPGASQHRTGLFHCHVFFPLHGFGYSPMFFPLPNWVFTFWRWRFLLAQCLKRFHRCYAVFLSSGTFVGGFSCTARRCYAVFYLVGHFYLWWYSVQSSLRLCHNLLSRHYYPWWHLVAVGVFALNRGPSP